MFHTNQGQLRRVSGKNFRLLNGRKLYEYIIEHVMEADCFDDIYIDTNSEEIKAYAESKGCMLLNASQN